jgi:2-methylcitrate dehydratase PrpD
LPYLTGAALVDGEVTAKTLTSARFRDPAILTLIQKIRFDEDEQYTAAFPRTFNCRMEVRLKSGEVITVHQTNPKGHPAHPMSDREIEEKFLKQAAVVLPESQSQALLDKLWQLEKIDDLKKLFALMLVPGSNGLRKSS